MPNDNPPAAEDLPNQQDADDNLPNPTSLPKICTNCLAPNTESADVCRVCFTPLSSHSTIDPIMSISARGDTFSKASTNPQKPIVFLGMWLIFGPMAIFFGSAFIAVGIAVFKNPNASDLLAWVLVTAFCVIPAGILTKTTINFFRKRPPEEGGFPIVEDDHTDKPDEAWEEPNTNTES